MIFDDPKKHGQLVLEKKYSHKLYISSHFAYFTALVGLSNGYFLNYFMWLYTAAASNMYWKNPVYGEKRNTDIFMCTLNIATHFLLVYNNIYHCNNYHTPLFLFYMGSSSYANALLFGRFFNNRRISSAFHLCFHIFMNTSAITLYTC